MVKKVISLVAAILLFSIQVESQSRKLPRRAPAIRGVKDKPSVYIDYARQGKREPLAPSEGDEGVWLRLHNNTRWKIFFSAFGVPESLGDVGMYYEIEDFSPRVFFEGSKSLGEPRKSAEQRPDPPIGYRAVDSFSVIGLDAGKSVLFSVPREHLAKGLRLRVSFNYEWEDSSDVAAGIEPEHYVYFYSSKLPKELQQATK